MPVRLPVLVADFTYPDRLTDDVVELRRWSEGDINTVQKARGVAADEAMTWVRRQVERTPTMGVSFAIAPLAEDAVGYAGLLTRPQLENGIVRVADKHGHLVIGPQRGVVGIGYWVLPDAQRNGFATRAVVLLSRWALTEGGLARIEALLDPRSVASQRVVEKSGFRHEGHLRSYLNIDGEWADALDYSLLPSDL
jgi:RimJ/RimL family protein N-acetyltransferase